MAGNVVEWCHDWDGLDYNSSPYDNPTGPASGTLRVVRGGYWYSVPYDCRAAERQYANMPDIRYNFIGFRCVLVAP